MIRFINLTDQIDDDTFNFAWYDTIVDKFLEFNGYQVFDSWDDFKEEYEADKTINKPCFSRFLGLFLT